MESEPDILERLEEQRKDLNGPCAQSFSVQQAIAKKKKVFKDAQEEIKKLRKALADLECAADAFQAKPPDDTPDSEHFNQLTTAGDCRELTKAVLAGREALGPWERKE